MKYILLPIMAILAFTFEIIWSLNYKEAKYTFMNIIDPGTFHYLED